MSITDELRSWAARRLAGWKMLREEHDELTAIADRIDAEHERVRAESIIDMTDESMAEHGWIRLPKDADGVPIHVGDEVEEIDCDGGHRVVELRMCESGWWVTANGICRRPHKYRHYHAPTVEDVLREFALAVCKDDALTIHKGVVEEYAKRLKLAEGEDA